MGRDTPDLSRLRAEQVEAVLRRAAEIDSLRGGSLSLEELRSVAVEAGISGSAVDAAINELGARPAEPPETKIPWPVTVATAVASAFYIMWWARVIASDGIGTSDVVGLVAGTAIVAATMFGFSAFGLWAARKVKRHVRAYINGVASA